MLALLMLYVESDEEQADLQACNTKDRNRRTSDSASTSSSSSSLDMVRCNWRSFLRAHGVESQGQQKAVSRNQPQTNTQPAMPYSIQGYAPLSKSSGQVGFAGNSAVPRG
jgi:hypothetical protein